jgi:DNA repair exonuclease SbcCD ATPase subunit
VEDVSRLAKGLLMKRHVFKFVKAKNFLCFGEEGIEINFQNLGNIVLIRGRNLDVSCSQDDDSEEAKESSNGAGKSSVPELIVYGLYGKTIKRPKKIGHNDVIHNKTGKKLYVEVQWDDYRVVRCRKPESLRLWKSAEGVWNETTEITLGGMPATQKAIEDIVGMSYETFVNVVVFTDDNTNAFLECDVPAKRQIVENLLSLEKYQTYSQNAKDLAKINKDNLKNFTREYEILVHDRELMDKRVGEIRAQVQNWKAKKLEEIKGYDALANKIRNEIAASDAGKAALEYQEAQDQLPAAESDLQKQQDKLTKIQTLIDNATEQYHKLLEDEGTLAVAIKQANQIISYNRNCAAEKGGELKELKDKSGTQCPACYGTVDESNCTHVLEALETAIREFTEAADTAEAERITLVERHKGKQNQVQVMRQNLNDAKIRVDNGHDKLNQLKATVRRLEAVPKPDIDKKIALLQQKMEQCHTLAKQRRDELEGPNPYEQVLEDTMQDLSDKKVACESKEKEIKQCEEDQPYFDYWIKAFGDTGIRKYVMSGIIPALNSKISYWLQYLIDNKLTLTFDDELEIKIERNPPDGTQFLYHIMSNGQRRRLNLSVSQAFRYIQICNFGSSPSVVFLDEVTTNIDPIGVQGIYNMICEMSKEMQVFVTTHDQGLLSLLNGCDTIWIEMKDGTSKLADS